MTKPKILPPFYFFGAFVAQLFLHAYAPMQRILPHSWSVIGTLIIAFGAVMMVMSASLFRKMGTPVKPFEKPTILVTNGYFKFTRNPMYLGMTLGLIGVAIRLGTLSPFLIIPIFVALIQTRFIKNEEIFLEGIFGQEYLDYKAKVRRWL